MTQCNQELGQLWPRASWYPQWPDFASNLVCRWQIHINGCRSGQLHTVRLHLASACGSSTSRERARMSAHNTREQPDCGQDSAKNQRIDLHTKGREGEKLTSSARSPGDALCALPRQVAPASSSPQVIRHAVVNVVNVRDPRCMGSISQNHTGK